VTNLIADCLELEVYVGRYLLPLRLLSLRWISPVGCIAFGGCRR